MPHPNFCFSGNCFYASDKATYFRALQWVLKRRKIESPTLTYFNPSARFVPFCPNAGLKIAFWGAWEQNSNKEAVL